MASVPTFPITISDHSFLVTGGAGFIGSAIVAYLITNGARKVRVLDDLSTGSFNNISEFEHLGNFEWMEGDIRNVEDCRKALEGIEYVSHQAALGSVPRSINDPLTTNAVNIGGFLNILEEAKKAGVKRMVYAASSSTYGDHKDLPKREEKTGNPLSPYAVTKLANELYSDVFSKVYGFHTIGLRYFNVFGPKQNPQGPYAAVIPLFIDAALQGRSPFINGDGTNSRDFTYVDNAVQANILALFFPGLLKHEVFNVACGASFTLNQLWDSICALTEKSIPATYREARVGDVKHSLADITKAKTLLEYQPQFDIEAGLRKTIEWFKTKQP